MSQRQEMGLEMFWGMVLVDDLRMGLLGGSVNRFGTDFGNGFIGKVLELVWGLVLCRFHGQRSP